MRNGLMVQVGQNGSVGGPSPMAGKNKSPSFHSNMSVDGAGNIIASPGSALPIDENIIAKSYEDHWVFEKIVLERVRLFNIITVKTRYNESFWAA